MKVLDTINCPRDLKKLRLKELETLASEIRELIIETVASNGGHLAPNLGVVELTIALHKVFDFDRDRLIFDVGHQSYAHKIISGRKDRFNTLRKYGGISGYTNPEESIYDAFIAGHSSTSLALALGFVKAKEIKKENYEIVALIGDGALTAGEAYEGLNNLGHLGKKVIVILNDNGMSISKNVGALSRYLYKLRSSKIYLGLKHGTGTVLGRKIKLAIKELLLPSVIFEEFGFTYLGPIDGHNIRELVEVFNRSRNINSPVLIHVITQKGKGYTFAEENPITFHGIEPFIVENGSSKVHGVKTFSDYFGEVLLEEAEKDDKIIVLTAAMPDGTKTEEFRKRFPDRFIDVGIAEQCAVTAAAALAKEGFKPVVAIYSTFMQRAFDQLIHDISILKLPVIFMLDRAGIVSDDGPTHQGIFDISYMNMIPSFVVSAPKDGEELKELFKLSLKTNLPFVIRYPKDYAQKMSSQNFAYEVGKSEVISEGKDLLIISYGAVFNIATTLKEELERKGISVGLINAIFLKPLDKETILQNAINSKRVITIEDGTLIGGFGSVIKNFLFNKGIEVISFGINDFFPEQGKRAFLLDKYVYSNNKISDLIEGFLREKKT